MDPNFEKEPEDDEDEVEFVGHYDRFFGNISDPAVMQGINEKEAFMRDLINSEKKQQIFIKSEREKLGIVDEGLTHKELIKSVPGKTKKRGPRKKSQPKKPVSEIARKLFEKTLAKEKPLVDYHGFQTIHEFITKNEYLTLSFIGIRSINLLSPIAWIKHEQWEKGVVKNYDTFTKPTSVKTRSRYDAINALIKKGIIFKKDFDDKKGIFYFLNTENGKKIYDLVEEGKLKRDDLEKLNELLNNKLLSALDPNLTEIFLQYRVAKFAALCGEFRHSDVQILHHCSANFATLNDTQNQTDKGSQNSLPIDHPKESPKVTLLDPDLSSEKNSLSDFSEAEQLKFLESRLAIWKKNPDDLKNLIGIYSLSTVFNKTIELEKKSKAGKIKPIVNFFPYLETSLLNEKIKAEKLKSKLKKQSDKKVQSEQDSNREKFTSLFKIFDSEITEHSLENNWYEILNSFFNKLINYCDNKNEQFVIEDLPKIKQIVSREELKILMLNENFKYEDVNKILDFIGENLP